MHQLAQVSLTGSTVGSFVGIPAERSLTQSKMHGFSTEHLIVVSLCCHEKTDPVVLIALLEDTYWA